MHTSEIIPRLEALTSAMSDKGLVKPSAHMTAYSHNSIQIFVCDDQDRSNRHCGGETVEAAFDAAEAYIAGLPSLEDLARQRFLQMAGAAADYAAVNLPGDEIASAVRASIVAGMQRLSENMLTDQSGAA